uniref:Uncharacterized protein n=1 Tax=Caenorhabditis japonica TaxID=281687 RepID=A0A8R1EDB7_CAEJA
MMVFGGICADGKTQLVFVNDASLVLFPWFPQWTISSPDLKPMDFAVWGSSTQPVATKNNANLEALKIFLKKAWDDLDVDYLRAVIDSYTKRL